MKTPKKKHKTKPSAFDTKKQKDAPGHGLQ